MKKKIEKSIKRVDHCNEKTRMTLLNQEAQFFYVSDKNQTNERLGKM